MLFRVNELLKKVKNKKDNPDKVVLGKMGGLDESEVLELAEKLVSWYNIKFPDSDLDVIDSKVIVNNKGFKICNSQIMSNNELLTRFSILESESLKCNYRSCCNGYIFDCFNEKFKNINYSSIVLTGIYISNDKYLKNKRPKVCIIVADYEGNIKEVFGDFSLKELLNVELANASLDDIFIQLRELNFDNVNLNLLKSCVLNKKRDVLVRKKLVYYVISKLVNGASDYEYGCFRGREFLKDFRKNYNFDCEEFDFKNLSVQEGKCLKKKKTVCK